MIRATGSRPVERLARHFRVFGASNAATGEFSRRFSGRLENEETLARFLSKSSVRVLNVIEETALRYAEVDVFLRKEGRPIPRNDVWIAALAIEHGMHLLTLDVHFQEIPLLLIEPPPETGQGRKRS